MKRRRFVTTLGAGLAGAFLPPLSPLPKLKRERFVERWSWAMGQAVHVMAYTDSEDQGLEACAGALAAVRRVEDSLSLFDDASELCELNRRAGKRALHVSDALRTAVLWSEDYRQATQGAFNAAVEPLMRVWGFRRPRRTLPSPTELAAARQSVATATVHVIDNWTIRLPHAHTRLDFGGIGVGMGIDAAVAALKNAGVARALIDVSGDCYGLGTPPDEPEGWSVGIAGSRQVVRLRNQALATSSNTTSVIELEKHILGHIIDPARGAPVDTRRQVTVVADLATVADACSTASLVSGRAYGADSADADRRRPPCFLPAATYITA
jgi:thiamine biosynthesis lipoprotein